jgi:hypothetical protein
VLDPQSVEPEPEPAERAARKARPPAVWAFCAAVGALCAAYLNVRTRLVPAIGQWYPADTHPAVILQLRAWFSGRLAPMPHPAVGWYDFVWGRAGMHTNFGLGLPVLGIPFHVVARLLGAPAFPDALRFLVLYAGTAALLAYALHRASRKERGDLIASGAVSAFVLSCPALVGLLATRFLIYDQTIAVGALWCLVLLAGVLLLLDRATTPRLVFVCAAAACAISFRAPLVAYGVNTAAIALIVAHRGGLPRRGLALGVASGMLVTALYLVTNFVRFGSPFDAGYANIVSSPVVNRLTRWGLDFSGTSVWMAAKELFATLFLLRPSDSLIIAIAPASAPASVAPYAAGERWREYYSPTFDLWVFAAWVAAFAVVAWRIVRARLWRHDRDLRADVTTIIGLWALPPSVVLFLFYVRVPNFATRYAVDMVPAYAAILVCVGMAVVDAVRERAPGRVAAVRLALAAAGVAYLSGGRGWPRQPQRPVDRKTIDARLAALDAISDQPVPPSHIQCGDPRGPEPVYGQFAGWKADCAAPSGMLFAFPRSSCITFTFAPGKGGWGPAEDESLSGFRARGDFDELVSCGAPKAEGPTRTLTMCEAHPPRFVLDGMRLYAVAWLDARLHPIDRLKLTRLDAAPACP